jgi:hypothetical protein
MQLGVEGMMISPSYSYAKAPDQEHFLKREKTVGVVRKILERRPRNWRFNHSPLFLEFLQGNWQLECTPWGNPTYNVFGWQKPCYLLDEGYVQTFAELLSTTNWSAYGRASGNPKCADCMMHCGYEPTAVSETFGSLRGLFGAARSVLFGSRRHSGRAKLPSDGVVASGNNNRLLQVLNDSPARSSGCRSGGCIEPVVISSIASLSATASDDDSLTDGEHCELPVLTGR